MQASKFVAKVLPVSMLEESAAWGGSLGGGGAPKSPEPCHTPGVSSPEMDRAENTDAASECSEDRIDLVQAEILAARADVLRMRALLRGLAEVQQLRAQVG
jgi:hypothetical protein